MREADERALAKGCLTYPLWVLGTGALGAFFLWPLFLGEHLQSQTGFSWITDGPPWRWPVLFVWWGVVLYAILWLRKRRTGA